MPTTSKPEVSKLDLLDQSLTCFAQHGLQGTSIDELTAALRVSHRTFYQVLGKKAVVIEQVYAYATQRLLIGCPEAPRAGEKLQQYLGRWWQQTAVAAQADPRAFRYWQFYRTSPHVTAASEPVLGPFAAVPDLLTQALKQPRARPAADALPLPVLSRWGAAQWTAAVEVVLTDPACQAQSALGQRLLTQAYASWWQSLGIAATVPAAATPPTPNVWGWLAKGMADHFVATGSGPTGNAASSDLAKWKPLPE